MPPPQALESDPLSKYHPTGTELVRIENDYTYHPPKGNQTERYVAIREKFKELALVIHYYAPPSRERSAALTELEKASFLVSAAIARNE